MLSDVLGSLGIDRVVKRTIRPLWPRWRAQNERDRQAFRHLLGGAHPAAQLGLAAYPETRSMLVVGYANPELASVQASIVLAARMAGFRVSVLLPAAYFAAADFYRALGANEIVITDVLTTFAAARRAKQLLSAMATPADLVALQESGVPVGKFAASTLMRQTRRASIDPTDPALSSRLIGALTASLRAVESARRTIAMTRPEFVVFYDHGYTPEGELFETALANGAKAITVNTAHKSGHLLLKCYDTANKDRHPGVPSAGTWNRSLEMAWTSAHWDALRSELKHCYESGLWYDEVGTQFNTRTLGRQELAAALALDPRKPVAVIFPHLFWDATFFWGTDLFDDYRDWFVSVLEAASKNTALNWIVKIHPANVVKNRRDGYSGEYSEVEAIRQTLGTLPGHISVIAPDSPISTYSLFDMMDYCLTVRGTVGLEAAIFGKQVLTAGTGRYDGYGFTTDSNSRAEYLDRLANLQSIPQPTPDQTERARRYAYGLFLQRPLETTTLRFRYDQNDRASLKTELALPESGRLEDCGDVSLLADWLSNSAQDDLIGTPAPILTRALRTSRLARAATNREPSTTLTWKDVLREPADFEVAEAFPDGRPKTGQIRFGNRVVPIIGGIPRFVASDGYARNFGIQWSKFRRTQLDSYTQIPLTFNRFWNNTRWKPKDVFGRNVLEVGSGAGRFTEVLLEAGANVVSFDLSDAVSANFEANAGKGNLLLFQGDVYDLPVKDDFFDFVFCYGVLQHTPEPEKAYRAIFSKLKEGGAISIDYYLRTRKLMPWSTPKYLWRPITTKMKPEKLLDILRFYIPIWLPVDTFIKRIPKLGGPLGALTCVPCWNYFYLPLSKQLKIEWAIMDTFDALGSAYDFPKTLEEVKAMVSVPLATAVEAFYESNGVVANARRRGAA